MNEEGTKTNTPDFSSLNALGEQLTRVEEKCPIHGTNLVAAFGKPPVCMECGREALEKRNKAVAEEASERYYKRKTYDQLEQLSVFSDVTLKSATFDTYGTNDAETTKNKEHALKIARAYYKGENFNTILTGKPGTGKSHLAISILKIVNENSKPFKKCIFVSIDELMRRIKDSFSNPLSPYTEQKMVELLIQSDLLAIDDLGAETGAISSEARATDFTLKTLYAIMNGRMNKPTIITTNLNSSELVQMYDSKLISRMFRGAQGHVIAFRETNDKRNTLEF